MAPAAMPPILYLPWISFPVGDQRKSGFLFPSVGFSSRSGVELGVPYYFNLAPNHDLTFDPMFYGRRGVDLGGRYRYLTERHAGRLQARLLPSDRLKDSERHWLQWRHDGDLGSGWHIDVDAQQVSDAEYFEDFSHGGSDSSTTFLDQVMSVSYEDERWALLGEIRDFQTIDRALAPLDRPYATLPRLWLSDPSTDSSQGWTPSLSASTAMWGSPVGASTPGPNWDFPSIDRVGSPDPASLGAIPATISPARPTGRGRYVVTCRQPGSMSDFVSSDRPSMRLRDGSRLNRACFIFGRRSVTRIRCRSSTPRCPISISVNSSAPSAMSVRTGSPMRTN
jgi:hypothetical protein